MALFRSSKQNNNLLTLNLGAGPTDATRVITRSSSKNPQPYRETPTMLWDDTTGPRNPIAKDGESMHDPLPSKG